MTRTPALMALLFAVLVSVLAPPAYAQTTVPTRRVGVRWDEGVPSVHFSATDLADEDLRHELNRGAWQRLLLRIYAYRADGTPIAVWIRSCKVYWDVWPRLFYVEYRSSDQDRDESYRTLDHVLSRCLVVRRVPIGTAQDYQPHRGQQIYFAALIELNPMTPAQVHRVRRWLSRPAGGGRVGGQAFFGSFVSLFVNRQIGQAQRTLRFRSQRLRVPR